MKAFISAIAIFTAICIFIGIHAFIMISLANDIATECKDVHTLADKDRWDEIVKKLDRIRSIWDKRRTWASLTISTEDIEQIEISLTQSRAYAELKQKPDFFGEFIMFEKLVEHIPHQEGFHIEEIL